VAVEVIVGQTPKTLRGLATENRRLSLRLFSELAKTTERLDSTVRPYRIRTMWNKLYPGVKLILTP